ncbi:MAG: porin [Candidatus Aminicenantes bacterium]|jgi:hypothetical protein|nr:porin [Candidatus Aminicenantes bacterium]MDH5384133.1 porin [Candidatus Aminicenantes bacterium]MDH5742974.1 porin [Candidatus Aminicenantes bacterium]
MKTKILALLFALVILATPSLGKITGYLSSNFVKSQEQGEFPKGTFTNPLFGLIFSGDISPNINYEAEFRITDITQVEIDQAWIGLGTSEAFQLKLGLYLVPFGRYNQINRPHQTSLINPPLHVEFCYPHRWRDIGILVEGRFSGFFYSGYIGNGLREGQDLRDGQQFEDNNKDKGKGGRFGLSLGQGVEVAYSIYNGKYDDENSRNLILHGVDLTWMTQDWKVFAEYTKDIISNPDGFEQGDAEGYFVELSLNFGNFIPLASYQKLKYTDPYHGPGFIGDQEAGGGISIDRSRWALGLIYIPVQNVFFSLEYDFNREEGDTKKDDLWAVRVALSF